ncbi:fibronectin type III domain-containing protein [Actinoplanes rectilineatus]|uniref:fibronectin type III domain-containing protein n=1 Tax=Actinoplanes rectilineatus TaxID=113571 RepID=UPI0005F2DB42|nr:fibronectin type III domain-containing protein [Actinoplanes rectilineatus]
MTSADTPPQRRWRPRRGHLVTAGTVIALVTALGLTVRGLGAADEAFASFDAASWVWSRGAGEVARVNGVTAKVDTRADVGQARGHQVQVSQSDRFVILRDVETGRIASMDLADLQAYWNGTSQPGVGVTVALHDDDAFVVDAVQGKVQQVDPATLQGVGEALRFPPGITGGVFDGDGVLWIAAPGEGTLTAVEAGEAGPSVARTEPVAQGSHDLALSALDSGVAVLDRTTNALVRVGDEPTSTITLPLGAPGILPPRSEGSLIAVTVPGERRVLTVDGAGVRADVTVPATGDDEGEIEAAVAWEGFLYVPEAGTVHVFDAGGTPQKGITVKRPGGGLELEVRENHLFINAPGASTARVVDDEHTVRTVDKYADDVLGGDPPPAPPTPPAPERKKKPKPTVTVPGAPRNVRAAAGDAEARVTWQAAAANGAAITRYVVTGADRTFQVGAEQRSLVVTGLTNGETYRFEVHAVNRRGDGPAKTSNAVRPTADVPQPPGVPRAEALPDGSVRVGWAAADGQGRKIARYTVTAITAGGTSPVGDTAGTSMTIAPGTLEYGSQYAFTVVAVNDRGAGSKASGAGESVVPFTTPGRPGDVDAATVADQAGAVRVTWTAAEANGRPVTRYVVAAGGKETEVSGDTAATLTGLGDGASVQVQVTAVNEAGAGEAGSATATTVAAPVITMTGVDPSFNAASVGFSVNAGGGKPTCTLTVTGGGKGATGGCSGLKAAELKPSTAYTFTVTAKNAAGTATKTAKATTDALYGTATCINGDKAEEKTYCDDEVDGRNGNEIFSVTRQDDDKQVGWVKNGTRLKAYCKKSGESVYAYVYNNEKRSTWWIQVDYKGKTYIPWAWLNLDGGDDLKDLSAC